MIESLKGNIFSVFPVHFFFLVHSSQYRPVTCFLNELLSVTSNNLINSALHSVQNSMKQFPCSSDNLSLSRPDLRCKLSQFCETTWVTIPCSTSAFKAKWEYVGVTDVKSGRSILTPFSKRVQSPLGPR